MGNNSFTVSWFTRTCYTMMLYVLVPDSLTFKDEKTNRGSTISHTIIFCISSSDSKIFDMRNIAALSAADGKINGNKVKQDGK